MISERRAALVIALAVGSAAAAAPARADDPLQITASADARMPAPVGRTFSQIVADQITLLGESLDETLAPLTFDAVDLRLDGRARRAHLRLGTQTRYLSLRVVGDVKFRQGAAEVDAAIDVGLLGTRLRIELPDFELVPQSYLGERYVEVRVPLLRRTF